MIAGRKAVDVEARSDAGFEITLRASGKFPVGLGDVGGRRQLDVAAVPSISFTGIPAHSAIAASSVKSSRSASAARRWASRMTSK